MTPRARRRWLTPERMVRVAVASGVILVVVVAVIAGFALSKGERPEEVVAAEYLEGLLSGDPQASYELTSRAYRRLVFPGDHALLTAALRQVAGASATVRVLGSERTVGSDPPESLVGYTGDTAVGPIEGVVTLYRSDEVWAVGAVTFDFPEASPAQIADFNRALEQLNEQVVARADQLTPTPSPTASKR